MKWAAGGRGWLEEVRMENDGKGSRMGRILGQFRQAPSTFLG
jgi:hypothetical protein